MAHQDESSSPRTRLHTTEGGTPQRPSSAAEPHHPIQRKSNNPIFDLLVGTSNDIEGLAAYALYKRHKRAWAESVRSTGREPTNEEDQGFARVAATSDQLDRYRKDAQDILISFANEFVLNERANIIQDAMTGRAEDAFSKIEGSGGFLSLVKVGVVSTLITTGLLALLAFGVQLFGLDLVDALGIGSPE